MKLMSITVHGLKRSWAFNFYSNPRYLEDWRKDGLKVNEVVNVIPEWIVNLGLLRPWCFFQDLWNL